MLIDIKKIQEEAEDIIRVETMKKLKDKLVTQMRVVANSKAVYDAEVRKLDDIKAGIANGDIV